MIAAQAPACPTHRTRTINMAIDTVSASARPSFRANAALCGDKPLNIGNAEISIPCPYLLIENCAFRAALVVFRCFATGELRRADPPDARERFPAKWTPVRRRKRDQI
jgi:hypothetical protein